MAAITEIPVEVTSSTAGDQNEPKESASAVSNLRKRFKKNESNSKRPSDAKWRQQQIFAFRPVYTVKNVPIWFIVAGFVFLTVGITLTIIMMDIQEIVVDYTQCAPTTPVIVNASFRTCDQYIKCKHDCKNSTDSVCEQFLTEMGVLSSRLNTEINENENNLQGINKTEANFSMTCQSLPLCECEVSITLSKRLRQIVHVYYGINNFFQNHRRYLSSKDFQQTRGGFLKPNPDCDPLIKDSDHRPYLPCGLIANSWFNDSIRYIQDLDGLVYGIDRNNIAWSTDRSTLFNDSSANPPTVQRDKIATPPNWPKSILDIENGLNNESLIVWFRVSAFPWFRKLYGRLVQNGTWTDLPASTYNISIYYSYPVTDFAGSKSVILAEVSWLGGRNLFLGPAYIVVGIFLLIAAVVLLIIHLKRSKQKTEQAGQKS